MAIIMSAGLSIAAAQVQSDRVLVEMPRPVTVADRVLEPMSLEIIEVSDGVLQFINASNGLEVEAMIATIPTFDNKPSPDTRVVLQRYGDDQFYVDQVWVKGQTYGYELLVPERVRSLESELRLQAPVSASITNVGLPETEWQTC
jgi:hypothetical protein